MTDKKPMDPFHKLLIALLGGETIELRQAQERSIGNLTQQIIDLSNEFLDADKKLHDTGLVTLALIDALASTIAQRCPDDIPRLMDQLDAVRKVLYTKSIECALRLHCQTHHPASKEK